MKHKVKVTVLDKKTYPELQQIINEDLIDCYYITVIPTILGSGKRKR